MKENTILDSTYQLVYSFPWKKQAAESFGLCIVFIPSSCLEWDLDLSKCASSVHPRPPMVVGVMRHLGLAGLAEGGNKASHVCCQSLMFSTEDNCSLDSLFLALQTILNPHGFISGFQ